MCSLIFNCPQDFISAIFEKRVTHGPTDPRTNKASYRDARTHQKKSGNWGLDEIDCHRLHKGQCTSEKENFKEKKFKKRKILGNKFERKILEKKI